MTSCIDDDGQTSNLEFADVEMIIRGKYDGDPFVKNRVYAYNDGARVRFSEFNFFVSELTTAVNADETYALDEVEYFDLALFQGDDPALAGFRVKVGRAPVNEYNGFSFGIGLSPELNSTTPDDYGQNHPLGTTVRYDADLNGFKFMTITGEVDYESDNNFDNSFNFVIGFNENYKVISSTQSVDILAEETNMIEIDVDLRKILDSGIRSIDFSDQLNTSANPSDEIMLLLNSNIQGAITVN